MPKRMPWLLSLLILALLLATGCEVEERILSGLLVNVLASFWRRILFLRTEPRNKAH